MAFAIDAAKYKVYGLKGGDYVPFACSQSMDYSEETEIISTMTVGNQYRKTFMPRFTSASLSLGGVMFLRDLSGVKYHILEFLADTLIQSGLNIKIEWTDQQGASQALTCFAFIKSKNISGTVGSLTKWNIDFQISGDITIGAIDTSGVIIGGGSGGSGIGSAVIGSSFIIG